MNLFQTVGERLRAWADQVENARAEVIASVTKDAIRDLAGDTYFGLPRSFTSYIDDYERLEGALHSIADYRDHFIHPFHVFCLGYLILREWLEQRAAGRIPRVPLDFASTTDLELELTEWFVASTYHDAGFPAEKLEVLIHELFRTTAGREVRSQLDWSSIVLANHSIEHIDALSRLFSSKCKHRSISKEHFERWFYKRLLEDHDHGALTALMLLNQGWRNANEWDMAYEAALAVALHSYRREPAAADDRQRQGTEFDIGGLAVEDFPLAFFLSYCDCAQEWGRKVLLELVKRASRAEAPGSTQYWTGLNNSLEAPVPLLTAERQNHAERVTTIVTIRYPTEPSTLIVGDKTLQDVFDEVAKRFESTWYLVEQTKSDFWIRGKDSRGIPIGHIHPAPRPSSPAQPPLGAR